MTSISKERLGQHVPETERSFSGLTHSLGVLESVSRKVAPGVRLFARLYNRDGTFLVFYTHRDQPVELKPIPGSLHPDNAFSPYSDPTTAVSDRGIYYLTITPPVREYKSPIRTKEAQPVDPILEKVSGSEFPDNSLNNFIKLMTERDGQVQIANLRTLNVPETVAEALGKAVRVQLGHKPDRSVYEQILLDNFDFFGNGRLQPGETVQGRIEQVVKALIHEKTEEWCRVHDTNTIKPLTRQEMYEYELTHSPLSTLLNWKDRFGAWINDPKLYKQGIGGLLFNPEVSAVASERALSRLGELKDSVKKFFFPSFEAAFTKREQGQESIRITIYQNRGEIIRKRTYPSLSEMKVSIGRERAIGRVGSIAGQLALITNIGLVLYLHLNGIERIPAALVIDTVGMATIGTGLLVHSTNKLGITSAIKKEVNRLEELKLL